VWRQATCLPGMPRLGRRPSPRRPPARPSRPRWRHENAGGSSMNAPSVLIKLRASGNMAAERVDGHRCPLGPVAPAKRRRRRNTASAGRLSRRWLATRCGGDVSGLREGRD
jgi:hypothetical protein